MKNLAIDAAFVTVGVFIFILVTTVFNLEPTSFFVGSMFGILLVAADLSIGRGMS